MASKRQRLLKKWEAREAREAKRTSRIPKAKTTRYTPKGYKPVKLDGIVKDILKFAKNEDLNNYDNNTQDYSYDGNTEYQETIDVLKSYGVNYNKFNEAELADIGNNLDTVHEAFNALENLTKSTRAGKYAKQTLANLQEVQNPYLWIDTLSVVVNAGLVEFGNSSYL